MEKEQGAPSVPPYRGGRGSSTGSTNRGEVGKVLEPVERPGARAACERRSPLGVRFDKLNELRVGEVRELAMHRATPHRQPEADASEVHTAASSMNSA